MLERLPWHSHQWELIERSCDSDRLAHAILLCGPRGIGLNIFAGNLAAARLCFSPPSVARSCGECKSCVLFAAGNHPDISKILPEEQGKQIKVDMIRELIEFINLKSQYQRDKIAIISPADAMNRAAANTLLKTLEEPPARSLIILISNRPELLPVTIRSRCQQIHFQPDYSVASVDWLRRFADSDVPAENLLNLAHGAPLAALKMLEEEHLEKQTEIITDLHALQLQQEDPVQIAEKWNAMGAGLVLQWLLEMTADMVRLKAGVIPTNQSVEARYSRLQQLVNRLHLYKLMQLYDLALKNYGLSNSSISYNTQGLLEDVIIYWQYQVNNPGG